MKNLKNKNISLKRAPEKYDLHYFIYDKEKIDRLCGAFFRGCLWLFLLILICGLFYAGYYTEFYKKWVQKRSIEIETDMQEHLVGEFFSFKNMKLAVTDAKILNTEREKASFPDPNKNLVAVKISGESDGTSNIKNWISDAYIRYGGFCYWQIPNVHCHGIATTYGIEIFENWKMTETKKGEGWLIFWLDDEEQEFTLCLEERSNGSTYMDAIHSIDICLEGE